MSDEPEIENDDAVEYDRDQDFWLQMLVKMAEGNVGFGITLTVGGIQIGGTLVSSKKYFEGMAKQISGAWNTAFPDDKDDGSKSGDGIKTTLEELAEKHETLKEGESPNLKFIHLENPVFLTDSANPIVGTSPDGSCYWRGHIHKVDGFMFGKMEQTET